MATRRQVLQLAVVAVPVASSTGCAAVPVIRGALPLLSRVGLVLGGSAAAAEVWPTVRDWLIGKGLDGVWDSVVAPILGDDGPENDDKVDVTLGDNYGVIVIPGSGKDWWITLKATTSSPDSPAGRFDFLPRALEVIAYASEELTHDQGADFATRALRPVYDQGNAKTAACIPEVPEPDMVAQTHYLAEDGGLVHIAYVVQGKSRFEVLRLELHDKFFSIGL